MYPNYYQRKSFNIQSTINTTIRGIQIINQLIPIIYQIKPLIDNTRQGINILKALNQLDDLELDEIVSEIKPINKESKEIFENML